MYLVEMRSYSVSCGHPGTSVGCRFIGHIETNGVGERDRIIEVRNKEAVALVKDLPIHK